MSRTVGGRSLLRQTYPRQKLGLAGLVAAAGLAACSGGTKLPPPLVLSPRPAEAVVTYRVTGGAAPEVEELALQRPFAARRATLREVQGPGVKPRGGTIATYDKLFQIAKDGAITELSGRQPGVPTGDQALAGERDDLVRLGLAKRVARRTVLGRPCDVYRMLEPPVGPIKRYTGGADHDDLCLDADGLLLSERYTLKGKVVQERVATAVQVGAGSVPAASLDVTGAAPSPGQGSVVEPQGPGDGPIADPAAPGGYEAKPATRFTLVQVDPNTGQPQALYTSSVWAFAKGGDAITVEGGVSRQAGQVPWGATDVTTTTTLGDHQAQQALRNDGAELRIDLGNRRWVRVRGTVALADLLRYAATLDLTPKPG